jgi:hypothetical protein
MTQFRAIDPVDDGNWLASKIKQNPEAFLVLAAGCALLLRTAGSISREAPRYPSDSWNDESRWHSARNRTVAAARDAATGLQDRVNETTAVVSERASNYAASLSDQASALSEKATGYVSNLSDQATDWGRTVADETLRMTAKARSTMQDGLGRMVKEQPFAVAALGVAVGAAVAAFLPPTRAERDTLRPLGDAAVDAVNAGLDQIKGAASATGEQLKDAAQRRGLSAEGMKDMAREATQTFTNSLAGSGARETQTAPSPQGASL